MAARSWFARIASLIFSIRPMAEKHIGHVSHYFGKIGVAVIDIDKGELSIGDTIHVKGHTSDFTQSIESMQLDGEAVEKAKKGQSIGVKIAEHVRRKDEVLLVKE